MAWPHADFFFLARQEACLPALPAQRAASTPLCPDIKHGVCIRQYRILNKPLSSATTDTVSTPDGGRELLVL